MKVLSLLLRNVKETTDRTNGDNGLNESPELIAQEYARDDPTRSEQQASMKVLSLLLRNVNVTLGSAHKTSLNESPELIAQE